MTSTSYSERIDVRTGMHNSEWDSRLDTLLDDLQHSVTPQPGTPSAARASSSRHEVREYRTIRTNSALSNGNVNGAIEDRVEYLSAANPATELRECSPGPRSDNMYQSNNSGQMVTSHREYRTYKTARQQYGDADDPLPLTQSSTSMQVVNSGGGGWNSGVNNTHSTSTYSQRNQPQNVSELDSLLEDLSQVRNTRNITPNDSGNLGSNASETVETFVDSDGPHYDSSGRRVTRTVRTYQYSANSADGSPLPVQRHLTPRESPIHPHQSTPIPDHRPSPAPLDSPGAVRRATAIQMNKTTTFDNSTRSTTFDNNNREVNRTFDNHPRAARSPSPHYYGNNAPTPLPHTPVPHNYGNHVHTPSPHYGTQPSPHPYGNNVTSYKTYSSSSNTTTNIMESQPPKKLDDLMATFGDLPIEEPHHKPQQQPMTEVVWPTEQEREREKERERERRRQEKERDKEKERLREEEKKKLAAAPSRNVPGHPVYYPPGEMFTGTVKEREMGQVKGKMKAKEKYKYKSGAKESKSSGGAVVPLCLPVCCAMPCVIM